MKKIGNLQMAASLKRSRKPLRKLTISLTMATTLDSGTWPLLLWESLASTAYTQTLQS